MGVAGIAREELGRRLVAVKGAASLAVGVAGDHGVQLLALKVRHAIHLFVELLRPFLLVLNDFLARITIHV